MLVFTHLRKFIFLLTFFCGGLLFSQWCPPSVDESNRSLSFDGVDDFVELPFIFDPNQDFTISFWYKKEVHGTGSKDIILSSLLIFWPKPSCLLPDAIITFLPSV